MPARPGIHPAARLAAHLAHNVRRLARSSLVLLLLGWLVACGSSASAPPPTITQSPTTAPTATAPTATTPTVATAPTVATPAAPASGLITIPLTIDAHTLTVELATTPPQRQRGLMFREHMPEDVGMLFVFPDDQPRGFWMKDTPLPLSIAFLDAQGRILNILDMQPFDTTSRYRSAGPARYALEVNQGWFAARGIEPGARCDFRLPADILIQ